MLSEFCKFLLVALGLAALQAPTASADDARFRAVGLDPAREKARALDDAFLLASALSEDPVFLDLIRERDDLRTGCPKRAGRLDTGRFVEAFSTLPMNGEPLHLLPISRVRLSAGSQTDMDGEIEIVAGHRGFSAPDGHVALRLLNTVVHEIAHLGVNAQGSFHWITDRCGIAIPMRQLRRTTASYQIGNTAQCYAWARSTEGPWRDRYDTCMAYKTNVYGTTKHPESRAASVVPSEFIEVIHRDSRGTSPAQ